MAGKLPPASAEDSGDVLEREISMGEPKNPKEKRPKRSDLVLDRHSAIALELKRAGRLSNEQARAAMDRAGVQVSDGMIRKTLNDLVFIQRAVREGATKGTRYYWKASYQAMKRLERTAQAAEKALVRAERADEEASAEGAEGLQAFLDVLHGLQPKILGLEVRVGDSAGRPVQLYLVLQPEHELGGVAAEHLVELATLALQKAPESVFALQGILEAHHESAGRLAAAFLRSGKGLEGPQRFRVLGAARKPKRTT